MTAKTPKASPSSPDTEHENVRTGTSPEAFKSAFLDNLNYSGGVHLEILQFKLDILWTMLDAMWLAYIDRKPPYFNV